MTSHSTSLHQCCTSPVFLMGLSMRGIIVAFLTLSFFTRSLQAQTDFAPGDIMFTGFDSDDPDAFSFVLLTDVVANTTIYITDRGWDNSTGDGFRDDNSGEGTISFVFTAPYACGTEIFFSRNTMPSPDIWEAKDELGNLIGTVTTLTSTSESGPQDPEGPELGCANSVCGNPDGDQLFIYQDPEPNPGAQGSFVTAIQYNGTGWNGDNDTDANSEKPTSLADGQVVRFSLELDNAKYDCDPRNGLPSFLRSVITNDNGSGGNFSNAANNWQESDANINLAVACDFCCGTTSVTPAIDAPNQILTSTNFTITINGTLAPGAFWELYTAGCGSGAPLQLTLNNSFTVTAPSTQQTVTYYVRSSETQACVGNCATATVCFVANLLTTCTDCTANPTTCGNCFLPEPYPNPVVTGGCFGMRLIFVLDESGSIGANAADVENGVMAFLNALIGQQIEVAIIEFSSEARIVSNYTLIDDNFNTQVQGYFDGIPFNGQTYFPGGGTNWHDAMIKSDGLLNPEFLLFFTDGVPTGWNTTFNACGDGSTTQTPEIVNPVKLANKLKSEGTHMFMLGVGNTIPQNNFEAMSGYVEYNPGINTFGEADWSIGEFASLATDLENFVLELCRTEVTVNKEIIGSACNGNVTFLFTVHNIGTESSTGNIYLTDTFPSGYTNIGYNGSLDIKICPFVTPCPPPLIPNSFQYTMEAIPPGGIVTLLLTADVLPTGNYQNVAWVTADNADTVSDTFPGINIEDDLSPTIMCPSNTTISCSASILPSNTGNAVATDPDGTTPIITYTDVTIGGPCPNEYTIQRTFKATDGCNNSATCIQLIALDDFTAPVISCHANITVQCTTSTLPATTGIATATDNCDLSVVPTFTDVTIAGTCPQERTINRTWKALDDCGNMTTCIQVITVDDSTVPTLTCPAAITIACTASTLPANTGTATSTDNCDATPTVTFTDAQSGSACPQNYTITRTWRSQDDCGNFKTCNQVITVRDIVVPAITCPPNLTIQCTASTLPSNTGTATSTDNCDASPTVTYTDAITQGACTQEYTIARTWRTTDDCGNSTTCVQMILVDDSTSPVISCPPNTTIQCTASSTPATTGTATATDNCDTGPVVTHTDVSVAGSCINEKTITRTWVATDACGNSSSCVQTIFVDDSTAPIITCPPNVTIECTASTLPANTGTALSTDNCDIAPVISHTDITTAGGCAFEYMIQRTWSSSDACGNIATCVQTIFIDDSTSPVISCPPPITIECTASTLPANTGMATSTDNCDPDPVITFSNTIIAGSCPQESVIHRTWTSTDHCGNSSTCLQIITIDDSVMPVINCPANITIACTESILPATTGNATATDNCDAVPIVTYSDIILGGGCPQAYQITRTWVAMDDCGNTSDCIQIITVQDNTAPVINCPPHVTIECTANALPPGTGNATAVDNCDATATIQFSDVTVAGDCPQEYSISRTWVATDDCNNASSCVQTITIVDTTVPVFSCPPNITIQCTESPLPANTGNPTVSDNCDTSPLVAFTDVTAQGSCALSTIITRTWTLTDACNNSGSCVQTITMVDTQPPVITCPENITIDCIDDTTPVGTGTATATDNCDMAPLIEFDDFTLAGPTPNGYTIERTWIATDACGNNATCVQNITVQNPLDPEITGLPFDTICSGESVTFTAEDQGLGVSTYTWNFGSGAVPATATGIGPHTVTYTYNASNGSTGANVTLTVTLEGCATVTETVANVNVNAIPNPAIMALTTNLCYYRARSFIPVAPEMPGFSYAWNFGAGASIPTANTYGPHLVEWSTTGLKTVRLIVFSNEAGSTCGDTATININVVSCPGNVTGRVRRPDGTGIPSVNLKLYPDTDLNGLPDTLSGGGLVPPIRNVFTTSTPVPGVYSMVALVPGQYVVVQTDLSGYFSLYDLDESNDMDTVVFSDPNDNILPVTIEAQEIDADNVFVDVTNPGTITGYVFEDFNSNGQPDGSEGIPGVVITLHADNDINGVADPGNALQSTLTSSIGWFTFGNLGNNNFVIVEQQPNNYNNVSDIDFTNDNDLVPNTNTMNDTIPVSIINNETDAHNYFKEVSICSGIVTNLADNGPNSLRDLIACAAEGDTIYFHVNLANQIIHLNSDRIVIDKNLVLNSTVNPRITIQSDVAGAFMVTAGHTVEIKNINIISGLAGFPGAAFENYGHLTLWDILVNRNVLLAPGNYLIFNSPPGILTTKGLIQIETD